MNARRNFRMPLMHRTIIKASNMEKKTPLKKKTKNKHIYRSFDIVANAYSSLATPPPPVHDCQDTLICKYTTLLFISSVYVNKNNNNNIINNKLQ